MKPSEIYTKAAMLVENGYAFSCCAIDDVASGLKAHTPPRKKYEALFRPNASSYAWGEAWGDCKKECRVLALCFMAAIAADEEKAALRSPR